MKEGKGMEGQERKPPRKLTGEKTCTSTKLGLSQHITNQKRARAGETATPLPLMHIYLECASTSSIRHSRSLYPDAYGESDRKTAAEKLAGVAIQLHPSPQGNSRAEQLETLRTLNNSPVSYARKFLNTKKGKKKEH